jgi:hypothetical protein
VVKTSLKQSWFLKYFEFHCDDCGSDTAFRSRRRTFSERYLVPVFFLQPVRCAECFRRSYRLIFMPVKDRMPEIIGKQSSTTAGSGGSRNVA